MDLAVEQIQEIACSTAPHNRLWQPFTQVSFNQCCRGKTLQIFNDPNLSGRIYVEALLDLLDGICDHKDPSNLHELCFLFESAKNFSATDERQAGLINPNYHSILQGN